MNWEQLFEDHSIDWVSRGPNTKRGEISIRCPWCGDEDPSHHLGISLNTENWGCHRNAAHRGKSPIRLVQALLGCHMPQARLTVAQYSQTDPGTLDAALAALTGLNEAPKPDKGPLVMPTSFRRIEQFGSTAKFWHYLAGRGFPIVDDLTKKYRLRCSLSERWNNRVIIPLYRDENLLGWTGRAITNPVNSPRYLSSDDAIKSTVFNEDILMGGGELLFLVEGPFDAIKLDYYGAPKGARATCVFGTNMSIDQISILTTLRKRFKKLVILFDPDAIEQAFWADGWLQHHNVTMGALPPGVEDPGALSPKGVSHLVASYI